MKKKFIYFLIVLLSAFMVSACSKTNKNLKDVVNEVGSYKDVTHIELGVSPVSSLEQNLFEKEEIAKEYFALYQDCDFKKIEKAKYDEIMLDVKPASFTVFPYGRAATAIYLKTTDPNKYEPILIDFIKKENQENFIIITNPEKEYFYLADDLIFDEVVNYHYETISEYWAKK